MPRLLTIGLVTLFALAVTLPAQAQFDRLLKRKLEREVSNMLAEKAAEIIARKAAQKMEQAVDNWLEEAMRQDSTYGGGDSDSAYYRMGRNYGAFLQGLNDAATIRESYQFDLSLLVETTDEDMSTQSMLMHYSKSEPVFATEVKDESATQYMVLDAGNDAVIIFREEKNGKKTAQAIPNFSRLAGMAGTAGVEIEQFEITPLNKQKKFAGYRCDGFSGESESQMFEAWVTNEIDVDPSASFVQVVEKIAPQVTTYQEAGMRGVLMYSKSWEKEDKTKSSSWETREVFTDGFTIDPGEYTFGQIGQD